MSFTMGLRMVGAEAGTGINWLEEGRSLGQGAC